MGVLEADRECVLPASAGLLATLKNPRESDGLGDCAEPGPWEERGGGCRNAAWSAEVMSGEEGVEPERRW
jgi:hypothetical protein